VGRVKAVKMANLADRNSHLEGELAARNLKYRQVTIEQRGHSTRLLCQYRGISRFIRGVVVYRNLCELGLNKESTTSKCGFNQ